MSLRVAGAGRYFPIRAIAVGLYQRDAAGGGICRSQTPKRTLLSQHVHRDLIGERRPGYTLAEIYRSKAIPFTAGKLGFQCLMISSQ